MSDYGRLHNIMEASQIQGDNLHTDLQIHLTRDPKNQGRYFVTKYLTEATHSSDKRNQAAAGPSPLPENIQSSMGLPLIG